MEERTIKASALADYLGIPYQTLHSWMKIGLMGERLQFPGRGSDRRLTFQDICTSRIIQYVLAIAPNFKIAAKATETFREGGPEGHGYISITVITKDESISKDGVVRYVLRKGDMTIAWSRSGENIESSTWASVLVIPVEKIMKEVKNSFPQLVEGSL